MAAASARAFAAELGGALADCPPDQRKYVLVGVLNRHLPRARQVVLVGGAAVELYTAGAYVTGDVDLIGDRESVGPLLEAAGFRRVDRLYVLEDAGLAVDLVGPSQRRGETTTELTIRGLAVRVVTVEDAIVDRLLAAEYWKSRTDWEQAVLLYEAHAARLHRQILEDRARANDVEEALRRLIGEIRARGKPPQP